MNLFSLLEIATMLAQTSTQKKLTIMNVGCIAVFFLLLVVDKSKFGKMPKKVLLIFAGLLIAMFIILYFFLD